ncbi:malectin [Cimex lectularius]|uniref:Malectin domain-containing protein n=1 Tax=Cimex lectularius TaxID=79782 RepID=A0A8I6THX0_CIMLE|nr:malectin [Cimex lectularius]XP_014261968.1 malectin [Cimex lectularius]
MFLKVIAKSFLFLLTTLLATVSDVVSFGEIIYAINAGGDTHTDIFGIRFERDPLYGKVGIPSDYGKQLLIARVPPNDQILYQTERYHHSTFGYDIPINHDGDYVMVLKFCEVYFNAPNMKVFDIVLNGDHTIVADLDIFDRVGRGVAHDEYISFSVNNGKLYYNEEESDIRGGKIRVEFIKGYRDNPKVNAIYVMRGKIEDVPKLPPLPDTEEWKGEESEEKQIGAKSRRPSGPKTPDPYQIDDSSIMLPLFVAFGAFLPLLFCLCKL